ncbi:MAG: delta-60 repeat domain-containing protein [candidate division WOR-3 bacterium]
MASAYITGMILLPQALWAKAYEGQNDDFPYAITQTQDGGCAVAGYTNSFGAGGKDFLVLKLSPLGDLVWAKAYGGGNDEMAYSITQTADGGFVVAGETYTYGAGAPDFLVIRLNPDGSLSWARTFGGASVDQPFSIIQTQDGGFAVAGAGVFSGYGWDFLIIKLASNGSLEWVETYGGASMDVANSIIQTQSQEFYVAGWTWSFGVFGTTLFVLKLAPDGSLIWAKVFDWMFPVSMTLAQDGGCVIASSFMGGVGAMDVSAIKLAPDGSVDWVTAFGETNLESANSITHCYDGSYGVAGITESFGAGALDFFIFKLASDGSLVWTRTFGGSARDTALAIAQLQDGDYAIAGYTESFTPGDRDVFVLKLSPDGYYPDCVQPCSPTLTTLSLNPFTPAVINDYCPINTSIPPIAVSTQLLTTTQICATIDAEELSDNTKSDDIKCTSAPGSLVFLAQDEVEIRLYSPDGRLVRACLLRPGENRINLGTGVYIWTSGKHEGKAIVR